MLKHKKIFFCQVNSWNAVKLIYNGSWLYGRVRSLDQNSTEVKGQKPLSGDR